ncbi:MAG: ROK family protein [Actinomycetota bacterium]|nr:ROK family protein [Actinomycetota bacterium]
MAEGLFFGVDVGGTKVAAGVVDGAAVTDRSEQPTGLGSAEALLDGVRAAVDGLVERHGQPSGIGVGLPSQIDFAAGQVLSSVNIPLEGMPVREQLEHRFGVPVVVDNDANCAALAEAAVQGVDHLVMLTLGTGVGGGVVIEGRTFRGADGLGAELGHFPIDAEGPPCPGSCPGRGCLEALCSGTALERDATEAGKDFPDSELGVRYADDGRVSGREAVEAAQRGDATARRLFDRLGRNLGVAIAGFVNIFQPERVAVGGGLSRAGSLFVDTAIEEAGARALPALWERTRVALAQGGASAGVIGAGVLAAQELGDTPMRAKEETSGSYR